MPFQLVEVRLSFKGRRFGPAVLVVYDTTPIRKDRHNGVVGVGDRGHDVAVTGEILQLCCIDFPHHPAAGRENQERTPLYRMCKRCIGDCVRSHSSRFDGTVRATELLSETVCTERLLERRGVEVLRGGSRRRICGVPNVDH